MGKIGQNLQICDPSGHMQPPRREGQQHTAQRVRAEHCITCRMKATRRSLDAAVGAEVCEAQLLCSANGRELYIPPPEKLRPKAGRHFRGAPESQGTRHCAKWEGLQEVAHVMGTKRYPNGK